MATETEVRAKKQSEDPATGQTIAPMYPDDHSSTDPAQQTPVEARQGFLGKPVLIVLVAGLALAIIAGIAVGYIPV